MTLLHGSGIDRMELWMRGIAKAPWEANPSDAFFWHRERLMVTLLPSSASGPRHQWRCPPAAPPPTPLRPAPMR